MLPLRPAHDKIKGVLPSSDADFTWAAFDAFCTHNISSCSMYAMPAIGRPSELETSLRVPSRHEMRSLSPGRGIPLRTSARNAKHAKGSAPEGSSLHR